MNFYNISADKSLEELSSQKDGLSYKEAKKRGQQYGKNTLPEGGEKGVLGIVLDQFKSPLIYILIVAATVSFAIGKNTDGWFIVAVLIINALIGAYQEYSAGEKAKSLKKSVKTYTMVLRNGEKQKLLSEDVTIGDIVLLESGTKIPADMRLIETNKLQVNESLITGESTDTLKDAEYVSDDEHLELGDRKNMAYNGSFVTKGRAKGVVTAIGADTEVGQIATMLSTDTGGKPPLVARIEKFSKRIAQVIVIIIALLFGLGLMIGQSVQELFFFSVALAVSSIPEGLPVAIVVALTAASIAMSKRNVIVRKLASLEGLGSCTLIASDKTGTLTQNELEVSFFVDTQRSYNNEDLEVDKKALRCAILANEVDIRKEEGERKYLGDEVDIALARWVEKKNEELLSLKKEQNVLKEIPYEPQNGYAGILVEEEDAEHYYIKGSPEVILDACDISSKQKEDIIESIEEYATKGYRNIALAHKKSGEDFALEGFEWIGFVAIIDPLREGVAQSVKKAREAGIDVSMITGDHPSTAFYIAKELGIAKEQDEVISGKELQLWIDKGEDPKEIKNKRVFARVSPEQKKRLVDAFQKLGHYVAVTGDGVNDAPALKHSNIGISMGISGTDVARETSDIILTDDHFGSIVNGIEEGRVAYDNIRKVVYLLVSTGFAEIILVGLSMLFLLPLPLLPVQLLWLNLVTNGIQHIALGLDKAEPGVLQRKPRDPKEPIFNKVMIRRIVIGGGYMGLVAFLLFSWLTSMGVAEDEARNLTLLLMVLFENVHAINSKSERVYLFSMNLLTNKLLLGAIIIAQGVHILSMHIPTMQNILGTSPVPIQHWMMLLVVALSLVLLMEFDKYIANRRKFGK